MTITAQASTMTDPSSSPTVGVVPEGKNKTAALITFVVILAVIVLVILVMVMAVTGCTILKGKGHKPLQSTTSDDDMDIPYNRGICIQGAHLCDTMFDMLQFYRTNDYIQPILNKVVYL